jgi:hypothetical protein
MRKLLAVALGVALGGCYFLPKKSGRGTNYDPPASPTAPYDPKRP